jgi:hypothetical protein
MYFVPVLEYSIPGSHSPQHDADDDGDDDGAPVRFAWKEWAGDSVPSPNLIRGCGGVWGEVQNMSWFEVRRARCHWTPSTTPAGPL